jgi:hypothetical protein
MPARADGRSASSFNKRIFISESDSESDEFQEELTAINKNEPESACSLLAQAYGNDGGSSDGSSDSSGDE